VANNATAQHKVDDENSGDLRYMGTSRGEKWAAEKAADVILHLAAAERVRGAHMGRKERIRGVTAARSPRSLAVLSRP
jgi:hypothetical protein